MGCLSVLADAHVEGFVFQADDRMSTATVNVEAHCSILYCEINRGSVGLQVNGAAGWADVEYTFVLGARVGILVTDAAHCRLQEVDVKPAGAHTVVVQKGSRMGAIECMMVAPPRGGAIVIGRSRFDASRCNFTTDRVLAEQDTLRASLLVTSGSHSRLRDCFVDDNMASGIRFAGSTGRLLRTSASGNWDYGIEVGNGSAVAIARGEFSRNGRAGVVALDGASVAAHSITSTGNKHAAIAAINASRVRLKDSHELSGNLFGLFLESAASAKLIRCDLRGNLREPLVTEADCTVEAVASPIHGRKTATLQSN